MANTIPLEPRQQLRRAVEQLPDAVSSQSPIFIAKVADLTRIDSGIGPGGAVQQAHPIPVEFKLVNMNVTVDGVSLATKVWRFEGPVAIGEVDLAVGGDVTQSAAWLRGVLGSRCADIVIGEYTPDNHPIVTADFQ